MKQTLAITRKELSSYFGSPMALIFLGAFLLATLFVFFWVDTFFARGIADVRPLFRWMPLLLIFLVAALTMRQWSEEAQTGTLEILLTLPVRTWQLVIGKFLSVMALVAVALILTLPLPITVSQLGNPDWGPVMGGYLAAILMAGAYAAIGLFISSRTNNQIVALILTVVVCGLFYLVGTRGITEFAGETIGGIMRALATGSRFESIERGVIDLRDLIYYLSLATLFLALNVLSLDSKRWSDSRETASYRGNVILATLLVAVNLIALNIWLYPRTGIRLDLTEQREYTLSNTTTDLLGNLQEPLLLRAYFSERTHPLLSPLVPRINDMLREYEIAGGGQINVEIVDPAQNPDLEAEANQSYGIRPTPFQVAGRYESAIVNAYFDILVRYGDQSEVLNFRDLIEVEAFRDGEVDVRLRNLEYDVTRTIKKVVFGFQNVESVLAALPEPAQLTLYVTQEGLPEDLAAVPETIRTVAGELVEAGNGKFNYQMLDPNDPSSGVTPQSLFDTYGLQPFATALFSNESYYLHMVLQVGEQAQLIYPTGDLTEADIRTSLESTLQRFSSGFLKVVGLWQPTIGPDPTMMQLGQTQQPPFSTWNTLAERLRQDYEVRIMDLSNGQVPPDVDVLLVVAPQGMADRDRYAIDQYLMRGGAVVIAGSNQRVSVDPFGGTLRLEPITDGLKEMLAHYGVEVADSLVLDPQNEPFPIAVQRQVGGFNVQEMQSIDYPYFVDVRPDGMTQDSAIISSLPAVTLNWVAPVTVSDDSTGEAASESDATTNDEVTREVITLLRSSPESWLRENTDIQPNTELYGDLGFPVEGELGAQPLAVSIRGHFSSFFADKEIPAAAPAVDPNTGAPVPAAEDGPTTGTIAQSPATARLVVIGSGDFLNDTVFEISSRINLDRYLNNLQLVQNTVDWSVEDLDLLGIRSRGSYARVLQPLEVSEQTFWEWANYGVVLLALILIGLFWATRRRSERPMQLDPQKHEQVGEMAAGVS